MRPQFVTGRSRLEPTPNPKDHTLSYYTMTQFKMILLQWKLFHSFDCVAFNHNSNQKLLFLCHDRVKEFSLHRWGEQRWEGGAQMMEMCYALSSLFLAIWLTFFFEVGRVGKEEAHMARNY